MELNRRGFLGALAAALVLDPERALWVPGKKLISIPAKRDGWVDFDFRYLRPLIERYIREVEAINVAFAREFSKPRATAARAA